MAYSSGGLIQASDYNTLITSINTIYGQGTGNTGYGGKNTGAGSTEPSSPAIEFLSTLSASSTISYRAWLDLRNAYGDCLLHQNQPLEVQQLGSTTPTYTLGQTMSINSNTVTFNTGSISQTGSIGATYTNGHAISINNVVVVLGTGTTVATAITDITTAAITGVAAVDVGGALELSSTIDDLILAESNTVGGGGAGGTNNGGAGGAGTLDEGGGGGGGAGHYGGGGAAGDDAAGNSGGGGGGASSFTHASLATSVTNTAGSGVTPPNTGDGDYVAGKGVGGAAVTTINTAGNNGGDGLAVITYTGPQKTSYTANDTFAIPGGVTSLTVKIWGAAGGSGGTDTGSSPRTSGAGGGSGYVTCVLDVTGYTSLTVNVGGGGVGGNAGNAGYGGGGGGYTSLISNTAVTLAVVAAGGGGGGEGGVDVSPVGDGGAGGGTTGVAGITAGNGGGGGGAGTPSTGGSGGTGTAAGVAGSSLTGGAGGNAGSGSGSGGAGGTNGGAAGGRGASNEGGGGGGAAGYYGGGGGGGDGSGADSGGGGGGGSSFTHTTKATSVTNTAGSGTAPPNTGDGDYVAGVGVGGAAINAINTAGEDGGDGLVVISYTGALTTTYTTNDTFAIPGGTTSLTTKLWGAAGASGGTDTATSPNTSGAGGAGGYVASTLNVTGFTSITVNVGGGGVGGPTGDGGDGGGGAGYTSFVSNTSVLLAIVGAGGGGGGEGGASTGAIPNGGAGGGTTGVAGTDAGSGGGGGGGGTSSAGGTGGTIGGGDGTDGRLLNGGIGGDANVTVGTALFDLGFTAGTYPIVPSVSGVVDDINDAAISGVTAEIEAAAAKIISTVNLILAEGTGGLSGAGFTAGTYRALPLTTEMDDTTDIATFFTELLTADQSGDLRRNDDNLIANAQVHTGEGFTTTSSGGLGSSVRTTTWNVQVEHEFSMTFTSQDEARYYFNTGGELRLSASRTGGSSTAQNTAWTDLLTAAGTYSFTTTEYFALTTTYQTLVTYEDTSGGPYDLPSPLQWYIQAKTDTITDPGSRGGKGSVVSFRSVFADQHVGSGGGPDSVDGTLTSYVDEKRATNIFVKLQPTYALIVALTAGS